MLAARRAEGASRAVRSGGEAAPRRSSGTRSACSRATCASAGLPESDVEQRVSPLYALYPDTETTILAAPTGIQLHPRLWSDDAAQSGEAARRNRRAEWRSRSANICFRRSGETLEEVVARVLTENRATIAVAESCTGGMLAERLTSIPGSSSYFLGGVVCYSNDLKTQPGGRSGGVDRIERRGEPGGGAGAGGGNSQADGRDARSGHHRNCRSRGGTPEKPVGLVHIALADERGPRKRRSASGRPRPDSPVATQARSIWCGDIFCPALAGERSVRLFVAFDFPGEVREALAN